MVCTHYLCGYDSFCRFFEDEECLDEVFVLFIGSKCNGCAWCKECDQAEQIVCEAMKCASPCAHFVTVEVGDRCAWKQPCNPFRTDCRTCLCCLPTLMRWGCCESRLQGCEVLDKKSVICLVKKPCCEPCQPCCPPPPPPVKKPCCQPCASCCPTPPPSKPCSKKSSCRKSC